MPIRVEGASEHNLREVDAEFGDGLTVVTGVSGSGKTSLVFDTLYHEARRRFMETFTLGSSALRLAPAQVRAITGLGPAVAVGQNLLNRNPDSTLASASGLHPFLRLLYARWGLRYCVRCGAAVSVSSEDEIIERLLVMARQRPIELFAPLLHQVRGSHRTLLDLLAGEFGAEALIVDGKRWSPRALDPNKLHDLEVKLGELSGQVSASRVREIVRAASALGAQGLTIRGQGQQWEVARAQVCVRCGAWFGDLAPVRRHRPASRGRCCALARLAP
jgi:excinuclease ABC subunit A